MAEEPPSSSSLPSSDLAGDKGEYDVFLSFRRPDTRTGLVDFLYNSLIDCGIRVFRDSERLLPGERITATLIKAINQSKVLIPIISSTYASSRFCLMELVQILECRRTMGRAILPIFYDIEPSELRHQGNFIERSFFLHEQRGADSKTIEKWKLALREIATITGFVTAKIHDRQHVNLIHELIPVVLQKLKKGRLTVTNHLVGVDHHVQEIMRKLGVDRRNGQIVISGRDVRILGIYGIGGVGKTTVAKVVYNQLHDCFECHSFLNEIRELCQNDRILSLQNQLISDLQQRSASFKCSDDAKAVLAAEFQNKQVLILLDDVEEVDQLDMVVGKLSWFGPGSRIIVTCRESDILSKLKEAETYKVGPMKEDEALELFSELAFRRKSPSEGFEDLSRAIISATGQIPSALELTGLQLYGKPLAVWEEMLHNLKVAAHEKVEHPKERKQKRKKVKPVLSEKLERVFMISEGPIPPYPWKKEKKSEESELPSSPFESLGTSVATIEHIISIEDRVKKVIELLQIEDEGGKPCMVVGIGGRSGIGKTTIAKAVYDRLSSCFDACSFLAEIGETAQNGGGIQCVQTKLICDILERDGNVASFGGIEFFLDVFSNIKALIVLDDVEEQSHVDDLVGNQLDWFGPGSRIIVTSENDKILQTCDSRGRACIYDVNKMDRALELFCKHALGTQGSISDYLEIGKHIIKATGELPLVIEVIGSFLRGKTLEAWKNTTELIKPQTENSREILNICYEQLDEEQKQIFGDIAWFANGVDSRIASYMWPNQDGLPSHHVLMPLAKIGGDNTLRMHKLLSRTIGPGKRRRPYRKVTDLKEIEKGVEVEALCFDFRNSPHTFTRNDFVGMPNIRFLKLDHAIMTGNFAEVFRNLRWLHWQGCPKDFNATEFNLTGLFILDLSWSKVTNDWGDWGKIKMENLKVLNLTGCKDLLISPKFSSFTNLEILILEKCSRLVHLDPSVGHLEKLLCLNLKSCTELNRLPNELSASKALKELLIDETSVHDIPLGSDSKELETLSAFNCVSLRLPDTIGELVKLRRLSLRNCCWIHKLPESIGQSPLEELDISGTGILELPDSFANLHGLGVLKMDYCFIRKFPSLIWHLRSLEEIHASLCRNIEEEVPGDIGKLENLRILRLRNSAISSLPPEIEHLSKLETLDVLHCDKLHELPALPSSLIIVHLSPKLKEKVSDLLMKKHCFITV